MELYRSLDPSYSSRFEPDFSLGFEIVAGLLYIYICVYIYICMYVYVSRTRNTRLEKLDRIRGGILVCWKKERGRKGKKGKEKKKRGEKSVEN